MTEVIPAVDISHGKCVRLTMGRLEETKVYYDDPLDAAIKWEHEGARFLHIIDLDAAIGVGENSDAIKRILGRAGIPCEVGGGVRSIEKAKEYVSAGAERVIFGTAAMEMRIVIGALKSLGPERVMAAVDHLMGRVAVKGWRELTEIDASALCKRLEEAGVRSILMTSIDRDGTMKGPSLNYALEVARDLKAAVYVAGGFTLLQDLLLLRGSRIAGVILGKSLYEGTIDLKKALEVVG